MNKINKKYFKMEYLLQNNKGFCKSIVINNNAQINIPIYMRNIHDMKVVIHNDIKNIIVKKDYIELPKERQNCMMEIEDMDTWNNFLSMFVDDFYFIHSDKDIKQRFIGNSDFYFGVEIELELLKKDINSSNIKRILNYMKNKYSDILYSTIEDFNDSGLEFNIYPTSPSVLKGYWFVFEELFNLGMFISPSSDVHFHVCSKAFGDTYEERLININKILAFLYYNHDIIQPLRRYKSLKLEKDCLSIKEVLDQCKLDMSEDTTFKLKEFFKLRKCKPIIDINTILTEKDFKTVEFRIFATPNSSEQFKKDIELILLLISIKNYDFDAIKNIKIDPSDYIA